MTMKNKIWFCSVIILAIFLNNCKKETNSNNSTQLATVTDIDGNVYNTVTIGTQVWMKENLKVTHYRNGDTIPNIADSSQWVNLTTGALCDYNNVANNSLVYGKLYNYYAIADLRNVCPTGWHVPTYAEWETLKSFLGVDSIVGGKLKETGTVHWTSPNTGADNSSGFTALPSGCRFYYGSFYYIGGGAFWWAYYQNYTYDAPFWFIYSNSSYLTHTSELGSSGFSIRCVKD